MTTLLIGLGCISDPWSQMVTASGWQKPVIACPVYRVCGVGLVWLSALLNFIWLTDSHSTFTNRMNTLFSCLLLSMGLHTRWNLTAVICFDQKESFPFSFKVGVRHSSICVCCGTRQSSMKTHLSQVSKASHTFFVSYGEFFFSSHWTVRGHLTCLLSGVFPDHKDAFTS